MSRLSEIEGNGECVSCRNSVGNAYVVCLFCKKSFHAWNCSTPSTSICTSSFHNLYKPLTDKTGVNANRPGRFLWACDACMTSFEVDQVKTENSRIEELQAQVGTLTQGMNDIKNMLNNKCIGSQVTDGCISVTSPPLLNNNASMSNALNATDFKNVESSCASMFEKPQQDSHDKSAMNVGGDSGNVKTTSVLIIDKFDSEMDEKENIDKIEDLIVKQKIDIENSYKNQSGKTVIVCKSNDQRDTLKDHISSVIPTLSVKAVANLKKTIVVAGFNGNYTEENIVGTLVDHNSYISDFIKFKASTPENHLSLVAVKPLKNDPNLFQVILRVSSELRGLILKKGDKMRVGMKRCPVYERFFVKRCFGCQHFGHFHAQCPTKDVFCCANCAGAHETHKCVAASDEHQCVNCLRAKRTQGINHAASSLKCPVFESELMKLKSTSKN